MCCEVRPRRLLVQASVENVLQERLSLAFLHAINPTPANPRLRTTQAPADNSSAERFR